MVSSRLQPEQKRLLEDQKLQLKDSSSEDDGDAIPYRIRDEVHRIFVTSKHLNQPVDVKRMSDGTKRVIWLVARAFMADTADVGCLGVEEVETGIHPRMMRNLLEAVVDALGKTKIILTSHSPYLIQYLPFNSLYVGVPNDKGVATFASFEPDCVNELADAAYDRGMAAGEYIFSLMSAGTDGEDTLRGYLRMVE